jgi:hypothetical protein
MARIYLETTVISFYFNARTEPEMVAREGEKRREKGTQLFSDAVEECNVAKCLGNPAYAPPEPAFTCSIVPWHA